MNTLEDKFEDIFSKVKYVKMAVFAKNSKIRLGFHLKGFVLTIHEVIFRRSIEFSPDSFRRVLHPACIILLMKARSPCPLSKNSTFFTPQ